jgi:hypothetical protein
MIAGAFLLYFQCSEFDGAKWQVSAEVFLSQFQIETGPPRHTTGLALSPLNHNLVSHH